MNRDRTVVIALGSNQGESEQMLGDAMKRLRAFAEGKFIESSVWRTKPVDCPVGSPDFLNAVVIMEVGDDLTPAGLLRELQGIEREFGRRPKKILNEPRPLDLDIISFGREVIAEANLVIPHPRAHERRFVLGPLAEILPEFQAPGWSGNARQLAADLVE